MSANARDLIYGIAAASANIGCGKTHFDREHHGIKIAMEFYAKNPSLFTPEFRATVIDKVRDLANGREFSSNQALFDAAVEATKQELRVPE